jgi:predicted nucleic acid-binding protein
MDNPSPVIDSELKTHSRRYFFDSSGIIALIDSGYLQRFCDLIPYFCITPQILTELTKKETLVKKIMSESISTGKIKLIKSKSVKKEKWEEYYTLGLHTGEISILLTAHKKRDIVVFDEFVARSVARAEGFSLTGLLGVMLKLHKTGKISKKEAYSFLTALNHTNFRMSSRLYESMLRRLSED